MPEHDRPRCEPGQFTKLSPAEREAAMQRMNEVVQPLVENMTPEQRRELQRLSDRMRSGSLVERRRAQRKGGHDAVR